MTYTRDWNTAYENSPPGSEDRSLGDNRIRELKVDVRERMNSIVQNWQTDPIQLKPELTGVTTGKHLYIAGHQFVRDNTTSEHTSKISASGTIRPTNQSSGFVAWAPVLLAVGTIVKSMDVIWIMTLGGTEHPVSLLYTQWDTTGTTVTLATTHGTVTGVASATLGGGGHTVATNRIYAIRAEWPANGISPGNGLLGARLVYDVPTATALR